MILISYKCKVTSKRHDESLYVMNYALLNKSFINIFFLCINILYIYVVKQILIFEHFYSFHCLLCRWHCLDKVVRSYAIWLWDTSFQNVSQCVFIPLMSYSFMNTKQNLIYILCLMQDFHMMRETKTKKLISVNFGRHRRPFCKRESITFYISL